MATHRLAKPKKSRRSFAIACHRGIAMGTIIALRERTPIKSAVRPLFFMEIAAERAIVFLHAEDALFSPDISGGYF
jgi:hypothetical protein